jgi:hypothetical protein
MAARRPDFVAYSVTQQTSGRSRWREVGVGFWNRKGDALTVLVDALPVSGRLVLSARRDEPATGEAGGEG